MSEFVFVLCTLTALFCSVLLLRAFRRIRTRLLFWSGACFLGLAVNNAMVFVDLILFPQVSLLVVREIIGLVSLLVLIGGFIWDDGGRP
jgi:hypothetical protein